MVTDESELAPLEEHLLACPSCVQRAEETQDYVDEMRRAATDFVSPFRSGDPKPPNQQVGDKPDRRPAEKARVSGASAHASEGFQ